MAAARSFPLVCFPADAFNFYAEGNQKEGNIEGSDGAVGEILILVIQSESAAAEGKRSLCDTKQLLCSASHYISQKNPNE